MPETLACPTCRGATTKKFGGVEGAAGIVEEWRDVLESLKEPLENSK